MILCALLSKDEYFSGLLSKVCWNNTWNFKDCTEKMQPWQVTSQTGLPVWEHTMGVFSRTFGEVRGIIPTIRASGLTFSLLAASVVISTKAAAPSFRVLALAAVTVPRKGKTCLRQRWKCYAKQLMCIPLRIVFPSVHWTWSLNHMVIPIVLS